MVDFLLFLLLRPSLNDIGNVFFQRVWGNRNEIRFGIDHEIDDTNRKLDVGCSSSLSIGRFWLKKGRFVMALAIVSCLLINDDDVTIDALVAVSLSLFAVVVSSYTA